MRRPLRVAICLLPAVAFFFTAALAESVMRIADRVLDHLIAWMESPR